MPIQLGLRCAVTAGIWALHRRNVSVSRILPYFIIYQRDHAPEMHHHNAYPSGLSPHQSPVPSGRRKYSFVRQESNKGQLGAIQGPQSQDKSLAYVKNLTGALSESHGSYRRRRHARKLDLGCVHPMELERRHNSISVPESSRRPLKPHFFSIRRKSRRLRIKLSSILATYIKGVSHLPDTGGDIRLPPDTGLVEFATHETALNAASFEKSHLLAMITREESDPQNLTTPQKNLAARRELESLNRIAAHQIEIVAEESLNYLRTQGYDLRDLAAWRWILTGKTAEEAAKRLEFLVKPMGGLYYDFGPVPMFVLFRLLLRTDMSWRAFSILLRQSWQILGSSALGKLDNDLEDDMQPASTQRSLEFIGLDALVILVVRLLRHARRVWPAASVEIAKLWIYHARVGRNSEQTELKAMTERDHTRLSFCYNRILSLLALPPSQSPFQSLQYRQQAQFIIIRQMNALDPPLVINSEGYKAVALVQLAHRKTHQEQRWARLKAKSWPPWKEDKLGVDAYVGVEQGISRASNFLSQAAEAGYRPLDWEKSSGILAGWDTDRSPTIQKRSVIVPRSSSGRLSRKGKKESASMGRDEENDADVIWAARIAATRTLLEAWTCFLMCKEQSTNLTSLIYHAIFEKVIFEEKRNQGELLSKFEGQANAEDEMVLPGDGKEVFESSMSQNQAMSTREPLPTFDTLLNQILNDQVRPSGRFLALLLNHARSYDEGVKILEASELSDSMKEVLLFWREQPVLDVDTLLQNLPDWLFAAYIGFLCKFAYVRQRDESPIRQDHRVHPQEVHDATLLLRHAFKLVAKRSPFYLPPWISLLKLLAQPKSVVVLKKVSLHPNKQAIPKFHKACRLLEYMDALDLDLDFAAFKQLCKVFKNSMVSARRLLANSSDDQERSEAQVILKDGLSLVKARFWRIVQTTDTLQGDERSPIEPSGLLSGHLDVSEETLRLPRLARIPHPAYLHDYIRLLGEDADSNGILDLVRWMSFYSAEILEEARESSNGSTAMRKCLTAIRAVMEQPLVESTENEKDAAGELGWCKNCSKHLEEIRAIIESNELWDGWPTDEEVEHYLSVGEERSKMQS